MTDSQLRQKFSSYVSPIWVVSYPFVNGIILMSNFPKQPIYCKKFKYSILINSTPLDIKFLSYIENALQGGFCNKGCTKKFLNTYW